RIVSRSFAKPARVVSISARSAAALSRIAAASAIAWRIESRRCSIMAATGRQKNRCSNQIRMATLAVWMPSVHQSIVMTSFQQRVGEQEQQRDHQAVDCHGLDHGETDEERSGDGVGGFWLARDSVHGGRDRTPFAEGWADRAERNRHGGGY